MKYFGLSPTARRQAAERPRASLLSGRSYGWSDGMDSAEEKLHFISLLMAVRTLSTVSLPSVIGLFPFPLTFAAWLSFWLEARDNAISSIRCLKGWEWFVRACMNICIACIGTFQSQCVCANIPTRHTNGFPSIQCVQNCQGTLLVLVSWRIGIQTVKSINGSIHLSSTQPEILDLIVQEMNVPQFSE